MSCKACDDAQGSPASAFYRWRTSNIEVRACEAHLREVFAALNLIQSAMENGQPGLLTELAAETLHRQVVMVKLRE